jgi:release factor glutamine methyltransferase
MSAASAASVTEALRAAIQRLRSAGVEDPARDARLLMADAAGLTPDIHARARRQPVSQIIGHRLFWGRSFCVTPDVLDPRPDTETLVEIALSQPFNRVLDLGTGSGAILVTLLAERAQATGQGVDISPEALTVARGNARLLGVMARAEFFLSDWFAKVEGRFDLIVANPPYIAQQEMAGLAPEVRDWEPHIALTPGGDGLDAYRALAAGSGAHLAPGGRIAVEIGPTQAEDVLHLFSQAGLESGEVVADIDGRPRVVVVRSTRSSA